MTDSLILAAILAGFAVLLVIGVVLWQARNAAHPQAAIMAELARAQTDAAARLEAMIRMLGDRQSQLQHAVNERLDSVSYRLGDSMQKTTQSTTENLQKLNERLAVIDSAQKNITELATQVTSLQSVLSNKQSRGAFGQGRMEAIVQDGPVSYTHLDRRSRRHCPRSDPLPFGDAGRRRRADLFAGPVGASRLYRASRGVHRARHRAGR